MGKTVMDRLFPLVYTDLCRLAARCLRGERPEHTLQRTALVHEVYLRLNGESQLDFNGRAHFLRLAARVMRQILVDHARRRNVGKRSRVQVPIEEASDAAIERPWMMTRLDDALVELEKRDERKARLIELRFFSGLTAEESASILEMDVRDVRRELCLAQAWLGRRLA